MASPTFWDDQTAAQKVVGELARLRNLVAPQLELQKKVEDLNALFELADESDDDPELAAELAAETEKLRRHLDKIEIESFLNGPLDANNAIVTIHAGAGGTESCDWAEMLFRMYLRWAERRGYSVEIEDVQDGEEAGVSKVTFRVIGPNAYGYCKAERGVHRLVRISPFDSNKRRHTSFASVEVLPEFNDEKDIEINEADLKIDAHRSSGAGGQHVNKTDSAIRITHIPTGIVVGCQTERSQVQNRETAMRMLKSKLLEIKEREKLERIEDITGAKLNIEWGSQIRSYVFMPYTLVKDNRTGYETGNITAVMDGEIDGFINEYLKMISKNNK